MTNIEFYRQHLKDCAAQYSQMAADHRSHGYVIESQKLHKVSDVLQNELIVFDSLMGYEEEEEEDD